MKHRTHRDFPFYRFYSDGRIKNKTTNHFIREYNIPMGSIGYLLGKGKSLGNGSIVINIDRVIIRG